jgi:ABC-2 type transport system permease protein
LLLKPVDSQFFLSTRFISVPTFFRFFAGALFLVFFMWQRGITTTPWQVFSFVVLGICGIILMYSIWFTIATLLIWQSNVQNLIDLLGMITGVAKYPKEILRSLWGPIAAVLLPIILVVNTPTKALLGSVDLSDVLIVISLSMFCLVISHLFWNFALRSYGSASG